MNLVFKRVLRVPKSPIVARRYRRLSSRSTSKRRTTSSNARISSCRNISSPSRSTLSAKLNIMENNWFCKWFFEHNGNLRERRWRAAQLTAREYIAIRRGIKGHHGVSHRQAWGGGRQPPQILGLLH